jgi:predicted ATPase/DNA-binding SARP family transcriptional activator
MRFGILGPLVAVNDEGRELALGGPRQRAVLAILLLHSGEALSSDRLIDELWGGRPPATAAKTLQVYVSNLRKVLGDGLLLTRPGGYVLETNRVEVDLARFRTLAADGRRAFHTGQPRLASERLREALELWRGRALADFAYESFSQGEAARLEEERQAALEDRIDAELALGEHPGLVGELQALVRDYPLRERLSGQLILALYRSGRQADALDAYRRVRGHLSEELGLEPGPMLQNLQMQVLAQAPSLDLTKSEPLREAGVVATAIPRPATRLIGRGQEVDLVANLLNSADVRLVTLTGSGGVGKTRLALAVARNLLDWFHGGAYLVRLAGVSDPASVLPMIAEQVGISGQSDVPLLDVLAHRFATERTLVVLDNFEQLVQGSALLAELMSREGELRLLVTSQVPLRVAAERLVRVEPLRSDDAVALFVDRAQSVMPDFAPGDDDRAAIENICARLDHMPLAIELAAARVRVLEPRLLERRLDRPLDLLTRGERDLPERQRSLRATSDWTHALLDPRQQSLLARLAVCVGAVPLSLVEAVAGSDAKPEETLDALEGLLEFSFARRQDDERFGVRFRVPQALRDFALERVVSLGQEEDARRKHAEHVAQLATAARLWKWGATAEQRTRLLAVIEEIRPAVAWAREHLPGLHARICADLASYWVYAGVISEVSDELTRARDSGAGSVAERAWIITLLAKCAQLQGASDSVQLAGQALAEWHSVDDELERALGLGPLTWVLRWDGRRDEAVALAAEALATLRRTGESRLVLRGLVFLAHALADREDIEGTEEVLAEADSLADGDPVWELAAIHGDCAHMRGDGAAAVRLYAESLSWTSTTGESHQMLMDLRCLGTDLTELGSAEAAVEVFELVRLEEERTGRIGDIPALINWFREAVATANASVSPETAQDATSRAREVPANQRAAHAIKIAAQSLEPSRSA